MAILGRIVRRALELRARLEPETRVPARYQRIEFVTLLRRARTTAFGRAFDFGAILEAPDPVDAFQERVPVFEYERMRTEWWRRCEAGEPDVCWPGEVPYFAQSSGTSGAPSKMIPVTRAMIRAIRRAGIKQLYSLAAFHLPEETFESEVLILGGSTQLERRGSYYVGDLSGISARELPSWFQHFYRPGEEVAAQSDWQEKLEEITRRAADWDARFVIEGRTSHFLSLTGEHLSVDNMVQAVQRIEDEFDVSVPEFTVAGVREGKGFAHHWFLGVASEDRPPAEQVRARLDAHLGTLNDDYRKKRSGPLGPITLTILPVERFYAWLERHGRLGGQNKFPRVLAGERLEDWLAFTADAETARERSRG